MECNNNKGILCPDPDFRFVRCLENMFPIGQIDAETVKAVPELRYPGDMLSVGGGCELAAVTWCKMSFSKFHQLFFLIINCNLPPLVRGLGQSTLVRSVTLHQAETCHRVMTVVTLNRVQRYDCAMISWKGF